ncbi:hypothetical protein MZM54_04140 [[Brevibacterium] frigoritolerans]|nr:hypothetical protein [Peribacillus frigoritolerans]
MPSSWFKPLGNLLPGLIENVNALTPTSPEPIQLAGGMGFSIILEEDGSVWSFGRNDLGQLGLDDLVDRSQPTRIDPLFFNNEKVIKIETSPIKTLALTENNNVYVWGEGTKKPARIYQSATPILDIEVSGHTEVNTHSSQHIVKNDGSVLSSGSAYYGSFGNGLMYLGSLNIPCNTTYTTGSSNLIYPALTGGVVETCASNTNIKNIKAGTEIPLKNIIDLANDPNKRYLLALDAFNTLFIFGEGKTAFATPLLNPSNLTISKIEAGKYPAFITTDGKLFYYQTTSGNPVEITLENSTEKIIDIRSGEDNLLILGESGKLFALGSNTFGQIGPVIPSNGVDWNGKVAKYTGVDNVKRIGTGVEHTILQFNDDKYGTLGRNSYGQLATTDVNTKTIFTKNPNINNVKDISSVYYSSFAVTADDKFYSWGGTSSVDRLLRPGDFNIPQLVKDFSSISPVKELNGDSISFVHGGLLLENGEYRNFGTTNWKRGLGKTSSQYDLSPVINTNTAINGRSFNLSSASQYSHVGIALSTDNKIYTWGYDSNRMLGLGYPVNEVVSGITETGGLYAFQEPIVPTGETFKKVYAGNYEKFILTDSGKVYAWGVNSYFRLGLPNSGIVYSVPTLVNTLPPIKDIAMGTNHTLFLDFQDNVWSAGYNIYGQLGIGNTISPNIPTKIPTLSNVKSIAAGDLTSFAVLNTGQLYSFGDNRYGQLGLGDFIQRNEPRLVTGVSDVKEVDGGLKHTTLINNSGELFVTGSDAEGQLGLGQSQVNATPITVAFPPNVSISNTDNQIFDIANTLNVTGNVYSETQGIPIEISYQIESQTGKTTTFVKSYTSAPDPESYSFSIPFTDYELGAYTLTVKATTTSGVSGQSTINFSIQDKINPTVNVDSTSVPKWSLTPVTVNLTADDIGGSGFRGYRYSATTSTSIPSSWSSIIPNKAGSLLIDKSGSIYLHIEVYDNIGNVTYLRTGPYYIDIDPPDFVFTEPSKWAQETLNLGVSVQDASNILIKKWKQGTSSLEEVKMTGTNIMTGTLPINMNGIYSFYAIDENNQETFETYNVSNINYSPTLQSSPSKILVPVSAKTNHSILSTYSHTDNGDNSQLVVDLNGNLFNSTNGNNTSGIEKDMNWITDFSLLPENTLNTGELYVKDSRGGISNKKSTQVEVYNPKLIIKSSLKGQELNWTHSKLAQNYRVLRDGEVIYAGTNNSFFDNNLSPNTSYAYSLEVLLDGNYIKVATINKNTGHTLFQTPSMINFPSSTLGNNDPILPDLVDLEYVKYEDFSDVIIPYSVSVSITEFTSKDSTFTPQSFVFKNVKKLNRNNEIEKTLPDVMVTSTPFALVNQDELSDNSYTKLEILKNNIELELPTDVQLNTKASESFNATIIWDIQYAP